MLRISLCDYGDAYILVHGTIIIAADGGDDDAKGANKRKKWVIFKNCAPFTHLLTA